MAPKPCRCYTGLTAISAMTIFTELNSLPSSSMRALTSPYLDVDKTCCYLCPSMTKYWSVLGVEVDWDRHIMLLLGEYIRLAQS